MWFFVALCTLGAQDAVARWTADLDYLVKGLSARGMTIDMARGPSSRGQKHFAKVYPRETFVPAIASLRNELPRLTDAQITLRLMRIIAAARVAHNLVETPKGMGFEESLPVQFGWLVDEMLVTSATPEWRHTLGLRVLRIGSRTPGEMLQAVAPFLAYEHETWLPRIAPGFLELRPVLAHIGVLGAEGRVEVALERPGGTPLVVSLPVSAKHPARLGLRGGLNLPVPLYLSEPDRHYWRRYLPETQSMYVHYRRCANDRRQPFRDFVRETMAELDSKPVRRVVIDLRRNGGGDSRVIGPLKSALAARRLLKDKLFVLIGPDTFSSALHAAIDFKQAGATLVGEPAAAKLDHYGEVKVLTLPFSRLDVHYTSKHFRAPKWIDGDLLAPDIAAPMRLADVLAGRDPALEAATGR